MGSPAAATLEEDGCVTGRGRAEDASDAWEEEAKGVRLDSRHLAAPSGRRDAATHPWIEMGKARRRNREGGMREEDEERCARRALEDVLQIDFP